MTELLYRSPDSAAEVWLGDCLDPESVSAVMGERKADALVVDAPYSERTHGGHRAGKVTADRAAGFGDASAPGVRRFAARIAAGTVRQRRDIDYRPWTPADVGAFAAAWLPVSPGWAVSLTDDVLAPAWRSAFEAGGRLPFAPIPLVEIGSRVRMAGDGPSCWAVWCVVSRPRERRWSTWGALPGAYVTNAPAGFMRSAEHGRVMGGKPLAGMLAIVGDYSRHGDLVVDPCCGAGTTGVAARTLGRRFIGIDSNREHAEIAVRRISEAREQITMPDAAPREEHQTTMFATDGE